MNNVPNPDLVKVTELFLIPSSFLVAALGTADTNPHRAAVSILGLVISIMWWSSSHEAISEGHAAENSQTTASRRPHRIRILYGLPILFAGGWMLSVAVHGWLWNVPLGK